MSGIVAALIVALSEAAARAIAVLCALSFWAASGRLMPGFMAMISLSVSGLSAGSLGSSTFFSRLRSVLRLRDLRRRSPLRLRDLRRRYAPDTSLRDNEGRTAFEIARMRGNAQSRDMILAYETMSDYTLK
jgi:hypothetical protein